MRIVLFCALVAVMILLFIILIIALKEMADRGAEKTAENIERIIKG